MTTGGAAVGITTIDGTRIEPSGIRQPYHLVEPSPWPIVGAATAGLLAIGAVEAMHNRTFFLLSAGLLGVLATMYLWWRDVVRESLTPGLHSPIVRIGLRYGVILFIASEVMFFVAFFWAFFHFALFPEHLADGFAARETWPPPGIYTFDPWHLPLLNTLILLLSGCTVTWAHHAVLHNDRKGLIAGLAATVGLGIAFTIVQAYEYAIAPFAFYGGGVYTSTFFLATGFHGVHVIIGTIFLAVCLVRAIKGHFTAERHFGFEAAAWYWHFVDVVWLFLFVCVYVWAAGPIKP